MEASDQECQECLTIVPGDASECESCGSERLARSRMPMTVTLTRVERVKGMANEEALECVWSCLKYQAVGGCE